MLKYSLYTLTLLSLLVVLLFVYGYQEGGGDQTELICLMKSYMNPNLYSQDRFVQFYQSTQPHFRTVSCLIPLIFPIPWEQSVGILFLLSALALLSGIERLSSLWIQKFWVRILLIFCILYKFSHWKIGYHDLYYPGYIASLSGSALASWALYFWFREKLVSAYWLLGLATLIHGPSGWVLFPVLWLTDFVQCAKGHLKIKDFIYSSLPFFCTGFAFSVWIVLQNQSGDSSDLFEWYVLLRNPHHYLVSKTRSFAVMMNVVFIVSAFILSFLFHRFEKLRYFLGIGSMILFTYLLSVEVLHSGTIAMTQFWILDTWMYVIAWIVLLSFIFKNSRTDRSSLFDLGKGFVMAVILVLYAGPMSSNIFPGCAFKKNSIEKSAESCFEFIRSNTDTQSVFVYPPSLSQFKSLSERSSYVDVKAVIPRANWMKNWWLRLCIIYPSINQQNPPSFQNLQEFWEPEFKKLQPKQIEVLNKLGVTHIMAWKEMQIPYARVFENEDFCIYSLDEFCNDEYLVR